MKKLLYYISILTACLVLYSCGSSSKKRTVISSSKRVTTKNTPPPTKRTASTRSKAPLKNTKAPKNTGNKKIKSIVSYAKTFRGTRYKFGGTTKRGMDCSGLVYTSFKKENVVLPRTSRTMATQGKAISLKKVVVGDLLFFKTNKRKNVISHVGLVVETKGAIKFIHASTSKGVIISSLNEKYWNKAFASARRVL
ncbi:C40 family peptidase [Aquimarina algicola]|uniref:NlpC/P60 family protein n=1 Tax=Aquimarina algicola TaxID=2589995 RepID=A0A504J6J0_9FLAO|nr:C40 family peptidase [Aquimarina algicola]TPN86134.1 NlpC/P60 family protein [Aquimarina algicola]